MPSAALHGAYWRTQTPEIPPTPGASANGGYVCWQMNVIAGSGFGVSQVVWEWLVHLSQTRWPSAKP